MTFGRRAFLAMLALVSPLTRAAAAAQPRAMSLDEFIAWSSKLTGHADLNRQAADAMLKVLVADPAKAAKLAAPDAAFERTVIAAWYTGIHDVKGQPQIATHTGALKFRALGIAPAGQCAGRFGAWAQRPAKI